jgi:hypothetical protein
MYFINGYKANNGHPAIVTGEDKEDYTYASLTHRNKTKGITKNNIKLYRNPDPTDFNEKGELEDSYVNPYKYKKPKRLFGDRIYDMQLHRRDKHLIKRLKKEKVRKIKRRKLKRKSRRKH